MKYVRINYALAATLVTSGLQFKDIYERCGAKSADSLRVGLHKRGVTIRSATSLPYQGKRSESVTQQVATEAAQVLRQSLASELQATTAALSKVKVKRNIKDLKARTEVSEALVRAAEKVEGWNQGERPVIGVVLLEDLQLDQAQDVPALDVSSSVSQADAPTPDQGSTTPQS